MILIRTASVDDSRDLFDWRNDDETRSASISQAVVTWAEHEAWLSQSLREPARRIYIAMLMDSTDTLSSVGMCRFDLLADENSAEVSINLNPAYRRRRLALSVLQAAIDRFLADSNTTVRLTATIRSSNAASTRIFTELGFALTTSSGDFGHYTFEA